MAKAKILKFRKPMTKKPAKLELYPIIKVEHYEKGKVQRIEWMIRDSSGVESYFTNYGEAEAWQQEHKPT